MYILAFETTGKYGSVSLINDEGHIVTHSTDDNFNHLKEITLLAEKCILDFDISKKDIFAVASSIGPGSFTGIRIGVGTARAVAQVLNIPCIAVKTLDSFKELEENGVICPILNARRGQVYGGIYKGNDDILKSGPYMIKDVLEKLIIEKSDNVIFFGDGIDAYEDKIKEAMMEGNINFTFADEGIRYQSSQLIAKAALKMYNRGEVIKYSELTPEYMRKAEAQQKLEEGKFK
ncbi:MAG TPA: tRNA (adenosine(37)-N6)-threonylcarbamoyltransferase complex dimerization subunit type 1 TsaB [Anaerovoracaceae bacterium]|nr:tRNA (adenosine(37)-N6)-threonylcarbamoyltransferase complex dimerization subunit type 1 TsaB [Anaerovoracaceae bacterium]